MKADERSRSSGKRQSVALAKQTAAQFSPRGRQSPEFQLAAARIFRDAEDDAEIYRRAGGVAAVSQSRRVAERAGDAQRCRTEAARSFFNAGASEAAIVLHGAVQARFAFTATLKRAFWIKRGEAALRRRAHPDGTGVRGHDDIFAVSGFS